MNKNNINYDNNLKIVSLSNNNLFNIPIIPNYKNIEQLYLSNNNLTSLTSDLYFMTNLQILDISYNNLSELIYIPSSLKHLNISNNNFEDG